jgi:tetraacyldisaccharide 4'-kinase
VISVGNITVGGTGKTPFAAWLVRGLKSRGERPALVARGYGQDELLLHRRWNPGVPVIAEQDRAFGAWKAAKKGATVVVLDDGFQHRRLARALDVVLVAQDTPRNARLLPRGPFREPFSALGRADAVVTVEKGKAGGGLPPLEPLLQPFLKEPPFRVRFVPDGWMDLHGNDAEVPDGDYVALAAVGDPESVSRIFLEATGREAELLAFPDHHEYTPEDVGNILAHARGRPVATTEKDAVKLELYRESLGIMRVLKLRLAVIDGEDRFWELVAGALEGSRATL